MYTALQAVQMMASTTLEDRQENFPCGLGSGTAPACFAKWAGFAPAHIARKGASCFTVVPLLWSGYHKQVPQVRRPAIRDKGPIKNSPQRGRSLVRSGQICQSVGSVEAVVDSTCRQGAPCLHWSPACEFVRLPGRGWFRLPVVVSLLVLLDTLGFAKTLLAPQTVRPVRLGH